MKIAGADGVVKKSELASIIEELKQFVPEVEINRIAKNPIIKYQSIRQLNQGLRAKVLIWASQMAILDFHFDPEEKNLLEFMKERLKIDALNSDQFFNSIRTVNKMDQINLRWEKLEKEAKLITAKL